MAKDSNKSFISLFSGCGGFDLGFIQAGFKCATAIDNDPTVLKVHSNNLNSPTLKIDLSKDISVLKKWNGIDLIVAGPPCQGFSTAGNRNLNDPRNALLIRAGEIAVELQPKVFVVENVTGVIKGEHIKYWKALIALLHKNNFKTHELRVNGLQLGLAQMRERIVLIAWKGNKIVDFTLPRILPKTLKDVIFDIHSEIANHNVENLEAGSDLFKIAQHIKPGQKLCNVRNGFRAVHTWDIPDVYGKTTNSEKDILEAIVSLRRKLRIRKKGDADPVLAKDLVFVLKKPLKSELFSLIKKNYVKKVGNRYDLKNTYNGKHRRLEWDQPSYTVDTRFTDPRYFLHPDINRGFSIREAARIQGFPDSFLFEGSSRIQAVMVGNAVPPPFGFHIACLIKKLLE